MATKKEYGEVEIRLDTVKARQEIKELEKVGRDLERQLDKVGEGDPAKRKQIKQQIQENKDSLVKLKSELKENMTVIINGDVAGRNLKDLREALTQARKEYRLFAEEGNPELGKKAQQIAVLENAVQEFEKPLKDARAALRNVGEEGSLNRLEQEAVKLREELNALTPASQRFAKTAVELDRVKKEIQDIEIATGKAKAQFTAIGDVGSFTYLKAKAQALEAELRDLGPATLDFVNKTKELQSVERRLTELNTTIKGTGGFWNGLSAQVKQFGLLAAGYLGFQAITSQVTNTINRNAQLSDSLTNVAKTTGLTDKAVKELQKSFSSLNTRTTQKDLLDLASVAGKLGLSAREDVLSFVKAADQIKVALAKDLGDNVEDAINNVGKLTSLFKLRETYGIEQSMLKVGSAINALGAASEASESYLVEFSKKFGGIAPNAEISIQDVLGLAATMDKLGQTVEVSTTAIGQLLISLGKDVPYFAKIAGEGTDEFKKRLIELGVDGATTFKQLLERDANKALIVLLENLKTTGGGVVGMAEKLNAMGVDGSRAASVLGVLSANIDDLKKQQALANSEFEKGTSLTNEFSKANNNFAASYEKLVKRITGIVSNPNTTAFFKEITDGLNNLLDNSGIIEKVRATVDKATQAFEESSAAVKEYQNNIGPLLKRYDDLKGKTSLTTDEQSELQRIIKTIAEYLPTAVTEFDKYGNAIDISRKKVDEFGSSLIKANQIKNKEQLTQYQAALFDLRAEVEKTNKALSQRDEDGNIFKLVNDGTINSLGAASGQFQKVKLSAEEILLLQKKVKETKATIGGYEELVNQLLGVKYYAADAKKELQGLSGKDTNSTSTNTNKTVTETNVTITGTDEAEKALKDYQNKLRELFKDIEQVRIASITNANEREIAELAAKYRIEREQAINNLSEVLADEKLTASQKAKYKAQSNVLLLALEAKYNQDRAALIKQYQEYLAASELKQDLKNLEDWQAREKLAISQNLVNKKIAAEEAAEQIQELELQALEYKLEIAKQYGKDTVAIEQEIADQKVSIRQKDFDDFYNREREKLRLQLLLAEETSEEELAIRIKQIEFERDEKKKLYKDDAEMRLLYDAEANKAIQQARTEHNQKILEQHLDLLSQFNSALDGFSRIQSNIDNKELADDKKKNDKKKAELKRQLDSKKISEEEYRSEIEKLDKAYDKKQKQFKREAWDRQQRADVVQSVINTALSVSRALAQPPGVPATIPFGVAAGVLGAIQTGVILSQPPPEFEKGAMDVSKGFKIKGPSHKDGGVYMINSVTKEIVGIAEGDEAMIPKKTVNEKADVVEDLIYNNGKNTFVKKFENGGFLNFASTPTVHPSYFTDALPQVNTTKVIHEIVFAKQVTTGQITTEGKQAVNREFNDGSANDEIKRLLSQFNASLSSIQTGLQDIKHSVDQANSKPVIFSEKQYSDFKLSIEQTKRNASIG